MIQVFPSNESCDVSLPGDNDPYWLARMGEGQSVSFTVPRDREMKGMALCVVYSSIIGIFATECLRSVLIVNYTKCTLHIYKHGFSDGDWHGIISNLESEDNVEIFVTFVHGVVVKSTTVYLICSESNDLEKEPNDLEKDPNELEKEPAQKQSSFVRFIKKIVT